MQTYQTSAPTGNGSAQVITADQQQRWRELLVEDATPQLAGLLRPLQESHLAVDELMAAMGKAAVEALLQLSAAEVAGDKRQGARDRQGRPVVHHGTQDGVVELAERKLKVKRPRLRKRAGGAGAEVAVPAYETLRQGGGELGRRMLQILLEGVSTRRYQRVLPAMADTLGISKSAVSRQAIEEGEKVLKELMERRFDDKEILVIYIDGIEFASHHILAAVGVDVDGYKHVLGVCHGAAENTACVTTLLEGMVERGVRADRRRLFVIDGAKALRGGIERVYGGGNPVQRCRNHKLRNVVAHLPEEQHDQAKAALRAAWKLPAKEGIARLEQLACWYEKDQPGAAASIREGLCETFTINTLGLPGRLRKCLATTNLIDSGHSAVRRACGRVTRWRDGAMALRWAACAFVAAEKRFKKLQGCEQLWMLRAHLENPMDVAEEKRTG